MNPVQYCRDKVAPPGSNLYYSLLFLPESQRRAALGLFAFQRQVMDIALRSTDPAPRQAQLDWWRAELSRMLAGQAGHHAAILLAEARKTYQLPQELFQEMLEASAMDVENTVYPSFKDLSLYCHRKSASTWMLAAEIGGYRERQTVKFAHELGTALELARIVLELGQDCARGRLYLPLDELEAQGIAPEALLAGQRPARFAELMRIQTARAREHFAQAREYLAPADRAHQLPGLILAELELTRLNQAEKQDFPVLNRRIELSPLRKLWTAWRVARRERHSA